MLVDGDHEPFYCCVTNDDRFILVDEALDECFGELRWWYALHSFANRVARTCEPSANRVILGSVRALEVIITRKSMKNEDFQGCLRGSRGLERGSSKLDVEGSSPSGVATQKQFLSLCGPLLPPTSRPVRNNRDPWIELVIQGQLGRAEALSIRSEFLFLISLLC